MNIIRKHSASNKNLESSDNSSSWRITVERELLAEYIRELLSSNVTNLLSLECRTQVVQLVNGLRNMENWAWEMFDSNGRPESGLYKGNTFWEGRFSQCNDVYHEQNNATVIRGKYFRVKFSGPAGQQEFQISVGTCFPSSCTNHDVTKLLYNATEFISWPKFFLIEKVFQKIRISVINIEHEKNLYHDVVAINSLMTFLATICLAILGTIIDYRGVPANTKPNMNSNDDKRSLVSEGHAKNYESIPSTSAPQR